MPSRFSAAVQNFRNCNGREIIAESGFLSACSGRSWPGIQSTLAGKLYFTPRGMIKWLKTKNTEQRIPLPWHKGQESPPLNTPPSLETHRVIWKYAAVLDAVHVALDLALQIGHAPAPVNAVRRYWTIVSKLGGQIIVFWVTSGCCFRAIATRKPMNVKIHE